MRSGQLGTSASDVHREAILMGAVRVFCTYVQHDVARMVRAGVQGPPESMFRSAIKNQLVSGEGPSISQLVEKIVHAPDNLPCVTDPGERCLLQCIMLDYDNARLAVQSGCGAQYRSSRLLPGIMDTAASISPEEETDAAVEAFLSQLNDSLSRWDAYAPANSFETIVHGMVLNHNGS